MTTGGAVAGQRRASSGPGYPEIEAAPASGLVRRQAERSLPRRETAGAASTSPAPTTPTLAHSRTPCLVPALADEARGEARARPQRRPRLPTAALPTSPLVLPLADAAPLAPTRPEARLEPGPNNARACPRPRPLLRLAPRWPTRQARPEPGPDDARPFPRTCPLPRRAPRRRTWRPWPRRGQNPAPTTPVLAHGRAPCLVGPCAS